MRRTVVETAAFLAAARRCLSDDECAAVVDLIAADPERGVLIRGGGGLRLLLALTDRRCLLPHLLLRAELVGDAEARGPEAECARERKGEGG